ncbi:MAG: hypothetical protein KF716_06335 [Anaerolineae bacterium]|nr:hypothetical protein [Anaerolineae bacterium]
MFRVPHFEVFEQNPVFEFELRRIKRLATPDRLWLYSALIQAIPPLVMLALYFVAMNDYVAHYFQNNPSAGYYYYSRFDEWIGALAMFILGLTAILVVCGDIYYMAVTVHSINHQVNSGHWDMLRLTPMDDADIFEAKQVTAHIRGWRVMQLEIALRLMLVTLAWASLLFPVRAFLNGEGFFGSSSAWVSLFRSFQSRPFYTLLTLITVLSLMATYIWEPRWRMRSLTSLGLYISSRVHNVSLSSVAAFFSIIGFHFVQILLIFGAGWFFLRVLVDYSFAGYNYDVYPILQMLAFILVIGIIFLFYRLSERWARQSALRAAFRSDL